MEFIIFTLTKPSQTMFSLRSLLSATIVVSSSVILAQPGSTSSDPYHVHHKHVSAQQGVEHHFGSTVAIHGDVLVASDETQVVEVLRRNMDGSWTLEATLAAPAADIDFGGSHALATNGDWIAVGARFDDTFGTNAGAVYMYKFDGLDWQYEGVLSHMAPHGSINSDRFGKGLAMDGDRMVVGSSAQNSDGGTGAIHYFQYHPLLDMWLEGERIVAELRRRMSSEKIVRKRVKFLSKKLVDLLKFFLRGDGYRADLAHCISNIDSKPLLAYLVVTSR